MALGSKGSEDALLGLKNFGWASKIRHSETPQAGSESVTRASNKQTLMSTDDRLTQFLKMLKQVQHDKNLRNRRSLLVPLRGFTLAEVLLTIGIIGVVAALTIPTLMQKIDERETISKVKKFNSTMSNAIKLAIAENGNIDTWNITVDRTRESSEEFFTYIKPYLKISKECIDSDKCYDVENYGLNGNLTATKGMYGKSPWLPFFLTDGSFVSFRMSDTATFNNLGRFALFYYDVNGEKGPNVFGKDMFQFMVYPNGFVVNIEDDDCNTSEVGWSCSKYIIQNDNMNYLSE